MANIEVEWEVEGILTPQESVEKMLTVIPAKTGSEDNGTFWTWEGKVRNIKMNKAVVGTTSANSMFALGASLVNSVRQASLNRRIQRGFALWL